MDQTMSVLNSASRFDANGHFNVKQRCKDAKMQSIQTMAGFPWVKALDTTLSYCQLNL